MAVSPVSNLRISFDNHNNHRAEFKNDEEYLLNVFPELHGRVNLVTAPFVHEQQYYPKGSDLKSVLRPAGIQNINKIINDLKAKGITHPRILTISDLQCDTPYALGEEDKVLKAIETLFEENRQRIFKGLTPLFDLIILVKNCHPVNHKSFTRGYYEVKEETFVEGRGFRLIRTNEGRSLGLIISRWCTLIERYKSKFTFLQDETDSSICLIPKNQWEYDNLYTQLKSGKIMPFTKGLQPISLTEHMFHGLKNGASIFLSLKRCGLLNAIGALNFEYKAGGIKLSESYYIPPVLPESVNFNPNFVKELARQLFQSEDEIATTTEVLHLLLESYCPSCCVQQTDGHHFLPKFAKLFEIYNIEVPVLAFSKGESEYSGRSPSSILNRSGNLATPILPILGHFFSQGIAPEFIIIDGQATDTALDLGSNGFNVSYWGVASVGSQEQEIVVTNPIGPVQNFLSFASRVASPLNLLEANFKNSQAINAQSAVPKFGTNIAVGPKTPGFTNKTFMPFNFVSIDAKGCIERIVIEEEPRWKAVEGGIDYKDSYPTLKYDLDNVLTRKYGLDFNAYISEMAAINLTPEIAKKVNISEQAKSYAFVYPCKAFGSEEFKMKLLENDSFFDELHQSLIEDMGEDIASLMIIGGFVYFDEKGNLIQAKPIVPRSTEDTLPLSRAILSSNNRIPRELKEEFDASVRLSERARDGLSNPVTAPELMSYGAEHFSYFPQGYIPESIRKGITHQQREKYNEFWTKMAPFGLFIYKFNNPQLDCILPILGASPLSEGVEEKRRVALELKAPNPAGVKNVDVFFKASCLICEECPPNIVYETKEDGYHCLCCAECDDLLAAGVPNESPHMERTRVNYHKKVIEIYNIAPQIQAVKRQLGYAVLNMQQVKNFNQLRIDEMAQSIDFNITVQGNIPPTATKFRWVYQAEKFWDPRADSEINQIYNNGGFAYFDKEDRLVGVNFIAPEANYFTKPLRFAEAEELILTQKQQGYCQLANDRKLPLITLPDLKKQGLRYYMWIHPGDEVFPSKNGQFIYFSADGTKVYAKKVVN